ncbi:DUF4148 domain-containing protein [Trinickia sp. NRRL B-1857]|uniref:DUF4148 domain-containing protein n=1 Tax=Trinickia sp. NRRL B-1857 TaxID=3162879 RepID=UPI003D2A88E8
MSKFASRWALALAIAALGAPVSSFAQASHPLTRAEVLADLIRVEQAGYNPARGDDLNYPADIQAAEAKAAMQGDGSSTQQDVGGVAQSGSSGSRSPSPMPMQPSCVGPAGFCSPYFGS